jgi:hypothetical protein
VQEDTAMMKGFWPFVFMVGLRYSQHDRWGGRLYATGHRTGSHFHGE